MMTDNRSILTDNFEVFYSKEYKNINVKKIGHMSANIRLNTDINLLEMDMEYSQVPKDELEEFFRAVHLKKKYYRLKNGAFISLEDDKQKKTIEWLVENSVGDRLKTVFSVPRSSPWKISHSRKMQRCI